MSPALSARHRDMLAWMGLPMQGWLVAEATAAPTTAPAQTLVVDTMNPAIRSLRLADLKNSEKITAESAVYAEKSAWIAPETVASAKPPIMAWLGPCIGPGAFEVGAEVRQAFVDKHSWSAQHFAAGAGDKFFCDLAAIARQLLQRQGVAVYGNDSSAAWCTYSNAAQWFSHRREWQQGRQAGRMAASIALLA